MLPMRLQGNPEATKLRVHSIRANAASKHRTRTKADAFGIQLAAAATAQKIDNIIANASATNGVKNHNEGALTINAWDTQNVDAKNQPRPAVPKMLAASNRLYA